MNSLQRLRACFQPRQWFAADGEFDPSVVREEDTFMWVFRKNDEWRYDVGFFFPDGTWSIESTYSTKEEASARVNYLNGGHNRQ